MAKKTSNQDVMKLDDATQKEIIQQYENIRQSGLTNMFDFIRVTHIAKSLGFTTLYDFVKNSRENYMNVLCNFSTLMKKFDIRQN